MISRQFFEAFHHAAVYAPDRSPVFRFRKVTVENRRCDLVFSAKHRGQFPRPDSTAGTDFQY